jgi:hypothetical protein
LGRFWFGRLREFNPVIGTIKIDVAGKDVERAAMILRDLLQDGGTDN